MSTLHLVAWGMVQWGEITGTERNAIKRAVDRDLRPYNMWVDGPGPSATHKLWRLNSRTDSGVGRLEWHGSLYTCCRCALSIIEPDNYERPFVDAYHDRTGNYFGGG